MHDMPRSIKPACIGLLLFILYINVPGAVAQCYDVRVALDGSGDFTKIQDAIDAAPTDLTEPHRIFIANGVYDEKLFIEKNFITLIGESRDSTIVTTAVLRRQWRETHPDDWGAATINIASNATDLTLAHLTVRNNFADVFPEFPDNNDHTFAIRGGGHRVIIIDCNIVATGGDTLSLWNTSGGMFYHNNCYIEGYVDYLAPRGYCYVTDCTFFGHNSTASIWHDGTGGEDHKLVIDNSYFTGVQGFALGRYHKDAAFYLLNSEFDETMKNQEIYHTGSEPLQWGERVHYFNCHRPFVDWTWFKDNLQRDSGDPSVEEIDSKWTYGGAWDPESEIENLLPYAFLPSPANNSGCAGTGTELTWVAGRCAVKHLVYFGSQQPLTLAAETTEATFSPGTLDPGRTYYWRIDEIDENGDTITGPAWQFETSNTGAVPSRAYNPVPGDGSDYETNVIRLDWDFQICDTDSFLVYYGSTPEELELQTSLKYPPYFRQLDEDDSTYYWRIDTKNANGVTRGDTWSFTLNPSTTSVRNPGKAHFEVRTAYPNPTRGYAVVQFEMHKPGEVTFYIFDPEGKLVDLHGPKWYEAGEHSTTVLDSSRHAAGIYFCQVQSQGQAQTVKLVMQ